MVGRWRLKVPMAHPTLEESETQMPKSHTICHQDSKFCTVAQWDSQKWCQALMTFVRCGQTFVSTCRTEGWFMMIYLIDFDVFSSLRFFVNIFDWRNVTHNHCQDSDLSQLSFGKKCNFQNFGPQLAIREQKHFAARCPNMAPAGPRIPQHAIRFSRGWHGRVGFCYVAAVLDALFFQGEGNQTARNSVQGEGSHGRDKSDEACHICAKWSFLANPLCTPPIPLKAWPFNLSAKCWIHHSSSAGPSSKWKKLL